MRDILPRYLTMAQQRLLSPSSFRINLVDNIFLVERRFVTLLGVILVVIFSYYVNFVVNFSVVNPICLCIPGYGLLKDIISNKMGNVTEEEMFKMMKKEYPEKDPE